MWREREKERRNPICVVQADYFTLLLYVGEPMTHGKRRFCFRISIIVAVFSAEAARAERKLDFEIMTSYKSLARSNYSNLVISELIFSSVRRLEVDIYFLSLLQNISSIYLHDNSSRFFPWFLNCTFTAVLRAQIRR